MPPHPLTAPLFPVIRSLLAALVAIALSPLIAPSVLIRLPDCLPIRLLDRISVRAVSLVASIARLDILIRSRRDIPHPLPDFAWLPPPVIRIWASPLPHSRYIRTFDQPGAWMTDGQLDHLQCTLREIAVSSIASVPTHRLFDRNAIRHVFTNRVVSIVYDADGPVGFTAIVYLPYKRDIAVHLGLTMIGKRGRGHRLQSALLSKALLVQLVNLCRISCIVTNLAASPAGVGSVSDYFFDCFPMYDNSNVRKQHHLRVALHVLENFRHEFGCSTSAVFDPASFVVYKSNERDGGGTHQFIKTDGQAVSSHKNLQCNRFVDNLLDYAAGDEIFQVASLNAIGTAIKYITSSTKRITSK